MIYLYKVDITFQGQSFKSNRELINDVFGRVSTKLGGTTSVNQYDSLLTLYQDGKNAFENVDELEEEHAVHAEQWKMNSDAGLQLASEFITFIKQFTEYAEALKFYYNMDEDEYTEGLYMRIKAVQNDRNVMNSLCQLSDLVRFHSDDMNIPDE